MVSYVIYSIYIYNIYILYIYIYIYMYICVYIGLWRVQIWENPISGQFFSCFFGPLTPPNTFDQGYLGLFSPPGVVWHISNKQLSFPSILCSFIGLKQRKWKWRKARHVSHGMKGFFWSVQITFFIDHSWREEKALKGGVSCTHHVDNLLCSWEIWGYQNVWLTRGDWQIMELRWNQPPHICDICGGLMANLWKCWYGVTTGR